MKTQIVSFLAAMIVICTAGPGQAQDWRQGRNHHPWPVRHQQTNPYIAPVVSLKCDGGACRLVYGRHMAARDQVRHGQHNYLKRKKHRSGHEAHRRCRQHEAWHRRQDRKAHRRQIRQERRHARRHGHRHVYPSKVRWLPRYGRHG